MKLNQTLIDLLSEKAGRDVTTANGAEYLRNDIEAVTGEYLSRNTVKRLVGNLPYESTPRILTLNIVSNYLGFSSWQLLQEYLSGRISDFNVEDAFIDLTTQPLGRVVILRWQPDRYVSIRHLGKGKYEVEESRNSKLNVGDILHLSQVAQGFPFMVKTVERNGESLGTYVAAKKLGIDSIETEGGE